MFRKSSYTLCVAFMLLTPARAFAVEVIQLGHFEALGTYTDIDGSKDDVGNDISAFYSPVLKISDTFCIIPLLDMHFNSYPQYLPEEDGNAYYNKYLVTNIHVAARKEFQPGWFFKTTVLGTWNMMQETREDNWGDGLYDYIDYGVNLELRHIIKGEGSEKNYSTSFEYYKRKYPNFETLVSSATVTPPEVREKDYHGFKYQARAEGDYAGRGRWYVEPYLLNKRYVDKHTVEEDGTLNMEENRADYELGLSFGGTYLPPALRRLILSLDNSYMFTVSNMDHYDSNNSLILTDDVFTPNYYAYQSLNFSPAVEYVHPLGKEKALKFRLGYSFMYRFYGERKAQESSGTYTDDEQNDTEHAYSATLRIPVHKNIDFVTDYTYTNVKSNQKFEDYYRYSYDSYTIKSGISWSF